MTRSILAVLALSALVPATVQARDLGAYQQSLEASCSGDYLRLCAGIDPNGKEVEACFKRKMAQVSPDCRTAINGYQGQPTRR